MLVLSIRYTLLVTTFQLVSVFGQEYACNYVTVE